MSDDPDEVRQREQELSLLLIESVEPLNPARAKGGRSE
jgi:hypothetical protein